MRTILCRSKPLIFNCVSFFLLSGLMHAQTVTVTPAEAFVGVGFTQTFHASVTGLSNTAVTWSLIGMGATNNPLLGSITSAGVYTAPAAAPAQNPVTIRATASDGKTVGIAYALIEPLGPTLTSVSPSPVNVGTYNVTVNGQGFVKGAGVIAGGVSLETKFVSSTQLPATDTRGRRGAFRFQ
jgi:hypothetical protein